MQPIDILLHWNERSLHLDVSSRPPDDLSQAEFLRAKDACEMLNAKVQWVIGRYRGRMIRVPSSLVEMAREVVTCARAVKALTGVPFHVVLDDPDGLFWEQDA